MEKNNITSNGFTLLELLLIVGIIVLMVALAIPVFRSFQETAGLNNTAEEIVNALRLSQNKTLASQAGSSWGVYFNDVGSPQNYILFQGASFSSREPTSDKVYQLSKRIEFSLVSIVGGGKEIVFNKVSGTTSKSGQVTLRLKSDQSKVKTVYVDDSGRTQLVQGSLPSQAQRLKDYRHVHFDYGRSIDTANEKLKLTFIDGGSPIQQEITIANNLKDGQLYWEGEVNVGGSLQKLKIHSHRLNNPDTQFSIHRGADENNKALKVDISGDTALSPNLISYNADDSLATKGNSISVSNLSAQ